MNVVVKSALVAMLVTVAIELIPFGITVFRSFSTEGAIGFGMVRAPDVLLLPVAGFAVSFFFAYRRFSRAHP